ncbi:MAG: hypothetical protein R2745_08500 [Vicinamibacterales bacterium]
MRNLSRGSLRRLGLAVLTCVAVQLTAPAPAFAWFGLLDKWSGPGGFWGRLYEVRVICFGPSSTVPELEAALARARQSFERVSASSIDLLPSDVDSVATDWNSFASFLEQSTQRWQGDTQAANRLQALIDQHLRQPFDRIRQNYSRPGLRLSNNDSNMVRTNFVQFESAFELAAAAIHILKVQVFAAGATGMFWSLCDENVERRVSIEINVDDWSGYRNANNEAFSGGERIRFITVAPSLTWNPIPSKKADVVDLGISGGYYAFSSKGFDSVQGFVVEPLRVELHAPTLWSKYPRTDVRRLVSMFTYRFALKTIPTGFSADAFAPGSHDGRIPAELVPMHGLFFNLNSLLSRPRKKSGRKSASP